MARSLPRPLWLGLVALLGLGVMFALLIGRGGDEGRVREVRVAAASDLLGAFQEIAVLFEAECDCRVRLTFGSSGTLAAQIREGLPVDVFASANIDFIDRLEREGLIIEETRALYGIGRIVLATPASSDLELTGLEVLDQPGIGRVTIANPAHAPYGIAAREALVTVGLWDRLQPRLVLAENASIAAEYVQTGNAPIGIIPLSLAIQRPGAFRYVLIDESLHTPLEQVMAAIRRSREPDLARDFVSFLSSPSAREVMRRYGFVLPGESLP